MIEELLDFTRARAAGGIPVNPRPASLTRICERAVEEARLSNPLRAISLEAKEELQGSWDPDRLLQLLANLIGNALQHGAASSPVSVKARREGGHAVLSVHNQGDPIPPDQLSDIFEPFRRGEWKSGDSSGLGLGLHIVFQIARAHGGAVQVQSSAEDGTTFTVRLPLPPASPAPSMS
jgi:signal transduction histidine kinase